MRKHGWQWPRITADTCKLVLGAFLLIQQATSSLPEKPYVIVAAMGCLALIPAARASEALKRLGNGEQPGASKGYYRVVDEEREWEQDWDRRRGRWDTK